MLLLDIARRLMVHSLVFLIVGTLWAVGILRAKAEAPLPVMLAEPAMYHSASYAPMYDTRES